MSYPSVVRIYATTQEPDYDSPWQSSTPASATGSGVVIGVDQVLTGAHVVAHSTFLQVQKISEPDKAVARVKAVCHDCDLALLEVKGERFMEGIAPAEIGDLPDLRDRVSVVGYPVGGEEISITEGVVSRIEVQRYSHSQRDLLAVTVDAAINDGNSGGPVYRNGKVAGIAFQTLQHAENIGEMVPSPLIQHFLSMVEHGREPKIPGLAITTQNLENPALRVRLGMSSNQTGVLVTGVEQGGSAWPELQPGDALLAIAGQRVANNGTVRYRGTYRTRYDVVVGEHCVGDRIELQILRAGEVQTLAIELAPQCYLVPRNCFDQAPTYFVYGGLVFQTLTRNFLATWDDWWDEAPKELLHFYYSGVRTEQRQEVVVLSHVLADEINVGYGDLFSDPIAMVNGQRPKNMREFVDLVEACEEVAEIRTTSDRVAVFDAAAAREANQQILERYRILRDRSPDLE